MQKNRIEIAGFLAAKPALRFLPSGTPVANARLAEGYTFKDSDGKSQKHTNWHSLSFYGELSEIAMSFDKGDNIFVEGSIEQRQFTPKDGVQRTLQEVIVRACHIVAPPRGNGTTKAGTRGEASLEDERKAVGADVVHGDLWPVA